jgi:ribonuclease-3
LIKALTHRSAAAVHNERLEYFGDALINFIIAEALYHQFPQADEGDLTRWRSLLVNRETLAQLAEQFSLGHYIILGKSARANGAVLLSSILSCAMEAIVAAIYCDSDFCNTREVVLKWYHDHLNNLVTIASNKDPKTLLQELLQGQNLPLPCYKISNIVGAAHQQTFTAICQIAINNYCTEGSANSRKRAEQLAAAAMLELLKK